MNSKGFTLIEMIMVVTILAMISLLTVPNIVKLIEQNKTDDYNNTINSIIKSASLYVSDYRYEKFNKKDINGNLCNITNSAGVIPSSLTYEVTLKELIDNNNLTAPVKNFCTGIEFNEDNLNNNVVLVTFDCSNKKFSYDIRVDGVNFKRKLDNTGNSIFGTEGLKISNCDDLY